MGLYLPGDGLLHRWHPLTKLALALASVLVGFSDIWLWEGISVLPWIGVLLLLALALADGPETLRVLLRRAAFLLLPILLSLTLVQGFFFPGAQDVLLEIGPLALRREGLLFGAVIFSRLAVILVTMLLVVLVTHPADLTHALTEIGVPREIAYIILAALQLIPRMQAKAESITNAQRARGLRTEGNILVRSRSLLPLIGPLLGSALHETEERALALEARAFRAPGPKTAWRQLHDTPTQRAARLLLLLAAIALFVWPRLP
jgi:energy-coupling factor transport system permease protein